jgi:uncharacterized membrane protein
LNTNLATSIKTVAVNRGAGWFQEAFSLWRQDWFPWTVICLILIFISIIPLFIPFAALLVYLFFPVLIAGLMLGCQSADQGGHAEVSALFRGFSGRLEQTILVGVAYVAGIIVIVILMLVLIYTMTGGLEIITDPQSANLENISAVFTELLLATLIGLLLYLPLVMALWFAPALIVLDGHAAGNAMISSFNACLANLMPFLVYGIVGLLLSLLATLPMGLGWLILFPVFIITIFISYKDIYH